MFVSSSKQHSLSHCHMPGRSLRRIQPHTKQKIFRVFLLPSLEAFLLDRVSPSIMLSAASAAPLGPNSVCSIVFTRWQGWPGGGHHDHSAQLRHNITILIHLNITPRDTRSLTKCSYHAWYDHTMPWTGTLNCRNGFTEKVISKFYEYKYFIHDSW